MAAQPALPYNQTAGYVNQPASRERAVIEAADGAQSWRFGDELVPVPDRVIEALRSLEDENRRLKKLLAETMLDAAMLKDIASKKW